ncbi:MAG: hypothetical protein AABW87_04070, partial [Nanoarchaeota archaeon]
MGGIMKSLYLLLALLLAVSVSAVSALDLDVVEGSVNVTVEPGEVATVQFQIKNNGTTDITGVTFNHTLSLSDNDDDAIRLSFSKPNPETIGANGGTANVTITVDTDELIDINTYSGKVTAKSGTLEDSFDFEINVEPVVCDFGIAGSSLVMDIEEPDKSDDFKPGDKVRIKVNVENTGSKDVDVKVDAFLFGDEDEIKGASSEVRNVDNDDDEDFIFFLDIPLDSRRIERDQEYSLIMKAFDDDNERLLCAQKRVDLGVELKNDDVVINEGLSGFEPSAVSCGDIATAVVSVINRGDDDQDNVYITLKNSRLRVSQKTNGFDLDDFDSDENNAASRRIQFKVPENAANGEYLFDAAVNYGGKVSSVPLKLIVSGCGVSDLIEFAPGMSEINVVAGSMNAELGEVISVPVRIANNGGDDLFSVDVVNIDEFAEYTGSSTLSLGAGQSQTVFVLLK